MDSLYIRLGGNGAIDVVIDGFYDRVLADTTLAPFFSGTNMVRQRRHLAGFVAAATGGPAYRGRDLGAAHAHLGIRRRDFEAVAGHLVAELQARGVGDEVIAELAAAIVPLADQIVTMADSPPDNPSDNSRYVRV